MAEAVARGGASSLSAADPAGRFAPRGALSTQRLGAAGCGLVLKDQSLQCSAGLGGGGGGESPPVNTRTKLPRWRRGAPVDLAAGVTSAPGVPSC